MFRISREYFDLLSQRITMSVGESKFKSEAYIDAFLKVRNSIYDANDYTTGGYIVGEVKLAGGNTLDLAVISDITVDTCHTIMYEVLLDWMIKIKSVRLI